MTTKDSVARGGAAVGLARMVGMMLSFGLFLVLARHSAAEAGIFRTVVTYIIIAEFVGMLGLQRWLSTELATAAAQRWPLFLATSAFSLGASGALTVILLIVASSGVYEVALSHALYIGALGVLPSGVFACVQAALIGIGQNRALGRLNLIENALRCSVALGLVLIGESVASLIWVFVVVRWGVTLYGFLAVRGTLNGRTWVLHRDLIGEAARQAPRFAMIIIAFMLFRNAGMLLLPAISGASETAVFAVAYQLFDLMLLVPSVLALTSNNLFASRADSSATALRRAATQLLAVTAVALFPFAALAAVFAGNLLMFLYGSRYTGAQGALIELMLTAALMMTDQVLSQVMVASRNYQGDLISISSGASAAVVLTLLGTWWMGATGAALALLLSTFLTIAIRLRLLRRLFTVRLLLLSIWRPSLAALLTYALCALALRSSLLAEVAHSRFTWLACLPPMFALSALLTYVLGGASQSRRLRMKQFLFHTR